MARLFSGPENALFLDAGRCADFLTFFRKIPGGKMVHAPIGGCARHDCFSGAKMLFSDAGRHSVRCKAENPVIGKSSSLNTHARTQTRARTHTHPLSLLLVPLDAESL